MGDDEVRGQRRESRMMIRTYQVATGGEVSVPAAQLRVIRLRDPSRLPVAPLAWPACRCLKCRDGETN